MKKKPNRKEFRREYGPRAPQKFAKAMQEYRRDMRKFKKTAGKPTGIGPISDGTKYGRQIAKPTGVGPVKSGAEYGRNLQKERQAKTPQPKPAQAKSTPTAKTEEKTKPTTKPVTKSSKGNTGTGRDGKFGRGTYGSGRPSDGKPKTKPKQGRGGSRARVNPDRKTTSISEVIEKMDSMLKLTHKKGDTKKVGGSTYRWNGRRWEKLNRPF